VCKNSLVNIGSVYNRIRMVDGAADITTIAGNGDSLYSGDNATAADALVWSEKANGYSFNSGWIPASTFCAGDVCSYTPDKNFNEGKNWWWINTWSQDCYTEYTPGNKVLEFVVTPCPDGPILYSPNGATAAGIPPQFSWQYTGPAVAYQVMAWTVVNGVGWQSLASPWYTASACSNGICTVTSPTSFSVSQTWWWLNTISPDCGYQIQPGGHVLPMVVQKIKPTVSIAASPVIIEKGQSATLTWSSTATNSCTIQPGIGTVGRNGEVTVTPEADTTYTITASGPGGVADPASVTVKIKPSVTLSASPVSIMWGETATLTWSSTGASSCTLQPGNITVAPSGSLAVSPAKTATYTIIAHGPNGQSDPASAQVTVKIIQPTVTISANPPAINRGESTTISWSTTDAVSCVLEPDDSQVDVTGSVEKTLLWPTTFTITATGHGGTKAIGSVTVNIIKPDAIHITYPTEAQLIKRPDTLVRGTIDGLTGDDIGVVVNGVVANVYEGEFAANHVPLRQGDNNTITAIATSSNEYVGRDNITVSADTSGKNVALYTDKQSGLRPLDITLKLTKSSDNSTYSLSYTPDNDSMENLGDNDTILQFKRRITKPGLYFITVDDTETLDNGTTIPHSDTISVMVESPQQLDVKLQGKWGTIKSAFGSQDPASALQSFAGAAQDKYSRILTTLSSRLPTIAANMQDIKLISVTGDVAKYRISRMENIDGQQREITYFIYFIKDVTGLWKIESF